MSSHSLAHLSDGALLRDLAALVSQDRSTTVALLAHLRAVEHCERIAEAPLEDRVHAALEFLECRNVRRVVSRTMRR